MTFCTQNKFSTKLWYILFAKLLCSLNLQNVLFSIFPFLLCLHTFFFSSFWFHIGKSYTYHKSKNYMHLKPNIEKKFSVMFRNGRSNFFKRKSHLLTHYTYLFWLLVWNLCKLNANDLELLTSDHMCTCITIHSRGKGRFSMLCIKIYLFIAPMLSILYGLGLQ